MNELEKEDYSTNEEKAEYKVKVLLLLYFQRQSLDLDTMSINPILFDSAKTLRHNFYSNRNNNANIPTIEEIKERLAKNLTIKPFSNSEKSITSLSRERNYGSLLR